MKYNFDQKYFMFRETQEIWFTMLSISAYRLSFEHIVIEGIG